MNRLPLYRVVAFLCFSFLFVLSSVSVGAQGENLLTNPGFETPFVNQGGDPPRQVAQGWTAWHLPPPSGAPTYQNQQPEYLATAPDATRIRSGNNAQLYTSFFATHTAGVLQEVNEGVSAGDDLTFSVYAYIWSSSFDEVDVSENDGGVVLQVGIDPNGGTDPTSGDIIWSNAAQRYDDYTRYAVSAEATASTVTVFVRSSVTAPVKNTNIYLDDAVLTTGDLPDEPEEPDQPTATPTATSTTAAPSGPTATPTATPTPGPTNTPRPTSTPNPIFRSTITHTVQRGDTVARLAALYGSTIEAIIDVNDLNENGLIYVGQGLIIPVRLPPPATITPTWTPEVRIVTATPSTGGQQPPTSGNTYVVQPGDTLAAIAARFNTTVGTLAQLNGIVNPDRILVGQRLNLPGSQPPPPPPAPAPQPPAQATYVVQPGDTLYRISVRFSVPLATLIRINGIGDPNRIFVGQTLRLQ